MKHNTLFYRFSAIFLGSIINLAAVADGHAVEIAATLHWSKRVELSTPVSGVIKSVLVDTGDRVKAGDILLQLDDRHYVAARDKASAELKDANEKRKEAKRELDRAQELYDRTVLSEHDLQTAKNAKVEADAAYATAKAALVNAELKLEYSRIRAPFDAYIIERHAEVGQTVVSQLKPETLLIVAAAGEMIARGYIEPAQLKTPLRGRPAQVVVAGVRYDGKVKHVGLEPVKRDKQGIYYEVDVVFHSGTHSLRAGQQVTVKLP